MTRLENLGDDGEWHEVPGVASVELEYAAEQQAMSIADVREAYISIFRAYAAAVRPVMEEAARVLAAAGRALREAQLIDEDGNPARRPDRPAWQSPYGPPRRHR